MGHTIRAREIAKRCNMEGQGAEIGVFGGNMSVELLKNNPKLKLIMVDSWLPMELQPEHYRVSDDWHAHLSEQDQKINYITSVDNTEFAGTRRTILKMLSVEAAHLIVNESLDWVFIDADHTYIGASSDIEAWLPKVKKGGYISGHDYERGDCVPRFGVRKAVDEAVKKYGWSLDLGDNFCWFAKV